MSEEVTKPIIGNSETKEIFVDGICQLHLVHGVMKMDMLTISPNGTDKPDAFVNYRLLMSLQQFLSSVDAMNKMVDQLVDKGIISRQ